MIDKATADAATLAIAVLGATLGVLNFWRSWASDRVRIRVSADHIWARDGQRGFTITVLNLSSFPVTVTTIGMDLIDTDQHMQIPLPLFTRGEALPVRLESRASCTAVQLLSALEYEQLARLRNAYIRTACGIKVKSSRRLFRQLNALALAALDSPPAQ